ncbi:MAG: hypothetical protein L0219_11790, partial [Phycisphaerales bacterium]|nr:hypothetical protein [Phycisphaerales bacterium]
MALFAVARLLVEGLGFIRGVDREGNWHDYLLDVGSMDCQLVVADSHADEPHRIGRELLAVELGGHKLPA